MLRFRLGTALGLLAVLAACGGGGGGSSGSTPPPTATTPTPTPTPTPPPSSTAGCSLRERQDWAAAQLDEWYLFPDTLPTSPNPAGYNTVQDYIDYLTATARAQGKDRFFTYITSIEEEEAYYNSGSNAGFGFRLALEGSLFVAEAFEGAPALQAGIDRGTIIEGIGTSASTVQSISEIISASGEAGIFEALGPSTPGVTRVLRVRDSSGVRDVTVTKAEYELLPVSTRYGAKIIDDGGRKVGYVNLRTFISTAEPALRDAFAQFRAQGVTDIIVDLRYNGGGLVRIAELMSDLLGANRSTSDVLSYTAFRPSKSEYDETRFFVPQDQSVAPARIAFIATGGSASASELVINTFVPYLGASAGLIGSNTFGKPVGQIGLDKTNCDDRLRVVAFATQNRDRQGDYYNGLAGKVGASCQAGDEFDFPLGDPRESSVARALDFLAGRQCTPIGATATTQGFRERSAPRELLTPARPSTAQREVPGLF